MKEPGLNLIRKFHLRELNLDFMGYHLLSDDIFSFHHLIIPSCKKGPFIECNGAILCCSTSHPYLHIIEEVDYDMFLSITSEMIDEYIKGYIDKENLVAIHDILNCFEREYYNDKIRCKFVIKDSFLQRSLKSDVLIRKRTNLK